MKKEEILRRVGSLQQLVSARRLCYDEGRARGLNAVEVCCGALRFIVLLDKGMDVGELSWRGEGISFLSKPGLNGRNPFDTHGAEAQRSIMGGLFFTCGFENICAPCHGADGREYPMHGRLRTSPAEHVSIDARWEGEDYLVTISGEIREAELFGENMMLRRSISVRLGVPELIVRDELCNEGFREEPALLMYHCNFGYPFLEEGCRLLLPTREITPRDAYSAEGLASCLCMDAPSDTTQERVYLHDLRADDGGNTFAALVNPRRELAVELSFSKRELPYFGQWKSVASGDYVMGLEPGNLSVRGRVFHEKNGTLPLIPAQGVQKNGICFRIHEGKEALNALERRAVQK